MPIAPRGYRYENGYLWPALDERCAQYIFKSVLDLNEFLQLCRRFDVVVQAGGCCGVWPRALGEKFDRVYTFEPCPTNFRCLAANAPAENVYKFNAALGDRPGLIDLVRDPKNIGAHYVQASSGKVPTMRVDDLALDACDLLLFDVEGYELNALRGALDTIQKFKPVIVAEDRGHSERYGVGVGQIEAFLLPSYELWKRTKYDVVLVPRSI